MKPLQCCVRGKGTPRCPNPYFITLRVQVVHPGSFRKTKQQWHFCEGHYRQFKATRGKDWFHWYGGSRREDAPVIGYEEVPVL